MFQTKQLTWEIKRQKFSLSSLQNFFFFFGCYFLVLRKRKYCFWSCSLCDIYPQWIQKYKAKNKFVLSFKRYCLITAVPNFRRWAGEGYLFSTVTSLLLIATCRKGVLFSESLLPSMLKTCISLPLHHKRTANASYTVHGR